MFVTFKDILIDILTEKNTLAAKKLLLSIVKNPKEDYPIRDHAIRTLGDLDFKPTIPV